MKRIGNRTLIFENTPVIKGYASVAGKKEYEGPLGKFFDRIIFDPYNGRLPMRLIIYLRAIC